MIKKPRTWIVLIVVLLSVATGGGYLAYTGYTAQAQAPQEPALETAAVYGGDILITADGTGNLLPATELELAFQTGGVLAEVMVEVGDRVQAGDVLARLDDTDARQAVTEAEMQVTQAEIDLELAQNEAEAGLLQADLEAAQADYYEAAAAAAHTGDQLTSARVSLQQALAALDDAQEEYDAAFDPARDWELQTRSASRLESDRETAAANLAAAKDNLEIAQAQYNLAEVGIDYSAVQDARIKVTEAEVTLANEPVQLEQLELTLEGARLDLEAAQRALDQMTLTAPVDGTVVAVAGEVGENVGTTAFVTLADLDNPLVRFWVEEADMGSVAVGNPVNIVFEALPDDTFKGEIVRVEPALVTVDSTLAVQAWSSLDTTSLWPVSDRASLLSGMTAEVEIIAAETQNALLVPVQALRELAPGQYTVFVVKANGELEMRPVEVGLKDYVNAEILSGLEPGEAVSLGEDSSSDQPTKSPTESSPPGMMRFLGG